MDKVHGSNEKIPIPNREAVELNSRGQRPRIEWQKQIPTLKGSNIDSTLTGSMNYVDDFRWRCHRLLKSVPCGDVFGELDTPKGVEAQVSAIKQILDQAGRRDYIVKVYPNGSHNLMEVPPDNPNEYVRLKRFPPGFFETMVD